MHGAFCASYIYGTVCSGHRILRGEDAKEENKMNFHLRRVCWAAEVGEGRQRVSLVLREFSWVEERAVCIFSDFCNDQMC